MKTIKILSLAAVILVLTSCGASKKAQGVDPEEILKKELARMAKENPCQYMATQWTEKEIRAYGEATGSDEESARAAARINAEAEINAIMNLWASDFSNRTATGAQANGTNSQERLLQQDQIRFAEGDLRGIQVLMVDYKKASKGVLCRMCVTMNADAAAQAILSQAQVQGVIENAEEFRKQANEAREQIRLLRTGTNVSKLMEKK